MKIPWKDTLRVWWSIFWRGLLWGALFGGLLGGVVGFIMGILGHADGAGAAGGIAGYFGMIPASILSTRGALQKHLGRLAAIAQSQPQAKPV